MALILLLSMGYGGEYFDFIADPIPVGHGVDHFEFGRMPPVTFGILCRGLVPVGTPQELPLAVLRSQGV
jgi:hypothetical protein